MSFNDSAIQDWGEFSFEAQSPNIKENQGLF